MGRRGETFLMLIIGASVLIGMIWGIKAIFVIAPLIIVFVYIYLKRTNGSSFNYIYRKKIKENIVKESLKIASGLICISFILLFFGSCINGCTKRNPDTPKDLELKYKIWRKNNPY